MEMNEQTIRELYTQAAGYCHCEQDWEEAPPCDACKATRRLRLYGVTIAAFALEQCAENKRQSDSVKYLTEYKVIADARIDELIKRVWELEKMIARCNYSTVYGVGESYYE